MPFIEVCERLGDACYVTVERDGKAVQVREPAYQAQLKGHPGIWGRGASRQEAIGSMLMNGDNARIFGIVITDLGKQDR